MSGAERPPTPTRYRITFSKLEPMRYTGNLDLFRTWERMLRRAALPLAYSEGFRPRPRITLASALALGCTSGGELVDVWLEVDLPPAEVEACLRRAAPPGIGVGRVERTDARGPALPTVVNASDYRVELIQTPEPQALAQRIAQLLSAASLPRQRRGKAYDLRPLVEDLRRTGPDCLEMRLATREAATGRPEEVVDALGLDPFGARYHRQRLLLREPDAVAPAAT